MKHLVCLLALLVCTAAHAEQVLRVYNWKDYFDPAVLEDFHEQTGIRVDYHAFTTTDELLQTMAGGDAYDVVVPSHFMLKQLLAQHRLAEIDSQRLAHYQELDPWVVSTLAGIPGANQHTVPYLWGSIGLLVNTQAAQATYGAPLPNSWSLLFDEQQASRLARCGIGMLDAAEETASLLLNYRGRSLSSSSGRQIERSLQSLQPIAGQLHSLNNWSYIDDIAAGKLCLTMSWSGHAIRAMEKNPRLAYLIPDEGAAIYIDTLAIPANAPNPALAYRFIDFLIAPQNAIRNARATRFYAPLPSTSPAMQALLKNAPGQVLNTEQRRRSYLLETLAADQRQSLDAAWQQIKARRN